MSRSEDLPVYICLPVLKSIAQIFNVMGVGWGEGEKLKPHKRVSQKVLHGALAQCPLPPLQRFPIQINIKCSHTPVVEI